MHFFIKKLVFLPTSLSAVVVALLVNLFLPKSVLADSSYQESPDKVNVSELINDLEPSCYKSPPQINVSDLINHLEPSCQESPAQANVSDLINNLSNISERSFSPPVLTRIGESREIFEQGIQQYQNGQYSDSEHSLRLSLDKLNGDNTNRFQAPQIRRQAYSIASTTINEPLDETYTRIMNSLDRGDDPMKVVSEYIESFLEQLNTTSTHINNTASSSQNTQTEGSHNYQVDKIEDAHHLEIKILRFLQRALIAQNQQGKTEEALKVAQLTHNLELLRVVPAVAYALNNEVLQGENFNEVLQGKKFVDTRLPKLLEPKLLGIGDIKRISQKQDATLIYYSVVSEQEIFVWIIQPTGKVDFRKIELNSTNTSLELIIKRALQVAASYVKRGQEGKALIQAVRQLKLRTVAKGSEQHISDNDLITDADKQKQVLQQLYQIIITPIKEFLPTNPEAHVVFIPQDTLLLAPFPALEDAAGQYLIEQHTIRIALNLQALTQANSTLERFPKGEKILIVGNPANPQTPSLPGAEQEAQSLALMSGSFPFIGDQATSGTILQRLSDVNVIHLATHGILDVPSPSRDVILIQSTTKDVADMTRIQGQSKPDVANNRFWYSLWYSKDSNQAWHIIRTNGSLPGAVALSDRLLTSQEIINLKLNAKLVVLSACNTAQGVPDNSTILGLPLSLGLAGVPNVVVSLWSVPDDSTQMLMYEFYSEMRRQDLEAGKIDIARALRKAMLKVKNTPEYRDPIHWAGFLLMNVSQ